MLEFYENALGLSIGDEIWEKLDIAQSKWRFDLQDTLFDSLKSAVHIGASVRVDADKFASTWPEQTELHYFEYTQAGYEVMQAVKSRQGKTATVNYAHVGLDFGVYLQSRTNAVRKMRRSANDTPSESEWLEIPRAPALGLGAVCDRTGAELLILDDSGIAAQALLSIPKTGLAGNPAILISSAERSWHPATWTKAIDLLTELGYEVYDPTGAELLGDAPVDYALSWFCLAVHKSALEGQIIPMIREKLRNVADRFRFEILGPGNLKIVAPAPYTARCEVVSLQTAAIIANAQYASAPCDDTVFDIYSREMVRKQRPLEVARFAQVDVFPAGMWKICVNQTHYVEEIGYSEREKLFGVDNYPDWDGRRTVYSPHPVLTNIDTPPGAILLGGDFAYYHWLLNWLPRLRVTELIEREFGHFEKLHFVISERLPSKFLDFISLILKRPFDVTRIPECGVWRFNDLIVPSFCTSNELHASISHWYRKTLAIPERSKQKLYYLSRADARIDTTPRRKVVNESEVLAALEPFGFEPLLLGEASARQQIDLFSEAAFVIGPHGAAFANMQFTPLGGNAIVLENEWNHTFMADMLTQAGHRSEVIVCKDVINTAYEAKHLVNGEVDAEARRSRDMIVDCDLLVARVKAMLDLVA